MNFSKLTRQLRREATTNPKKAAFLGFMFVVALWFWSPLVWGWIGEKDSSAGPDVASPQAGQPDGTPVVAISEGNAAPDAAEVPQHSWRQLAQWMDDDRLTLAVAMTDRGRDPFLASKPRKDETISELQEEESEDITPESLGLVLSGTIVGSQRRVALINGKPYRQDQSVTLVKDGKEIEFVIEGIRSRRVVLRRNDKEFELRTQSGTLSGRIQRTN
ncbi:MAG: hypothetical protein V3R99_13115 [Thermoguttaceae bacterium]